MSLITCCPSCATRFRVVPDQLRISDGWVRCGRCQEVFDAAAALQEQQEAALAAPQPAVPPPPPPPQHRRQKLRLRLRAHLCPGQNFSRSLRRNWNRRHSRNQNLSLNQNRNRSQ